MARRKSPSIEETDGGQFPALKNTVRLRHWRKLEKRE